MSCAVLTILVGLVMSPVVTLMFGVALLPFSWPYLAAVPILLGTAVALSQGGVGQAWWRRLPPVRTAAWLIATFLVLSLASALMAHLDTPGIVAVAGLAGVVDARAWYGAHHRRGPALDGKATAPMGLARHAAADPARAARPDSWVPVAPLAAVMVIALVVGLARLAFTGAVRFDPGPVVASAEGRRTRRGRPYRQHRRGRRSQQRRRAASARAADTAAGAKARGAVLVVAGFGSSCCNAADTLRAAEPDMLVASSPTWA